MRSRSPSDAWKRRLAVILPLIVVGVVAAAMSRLMQIRRESTAAVQEAYELTGDLRQLRGRLVDAESGQRGFLITGDTMYLAPYHNAESDVRTLLAGIRARVGDDGEARSGLERLSELLDQRFEILGRPLRVRRQEDFLAAQEELVQGGGRDVMARVRATMGELERVKLAQLDSLLVRQDRFTLAVQVLLVVGALLIAATAFLTNRMLHAFAERQRLLNRDLTGANEKLQEQAAELEIQAEELQAHTTQLEETTSALELSNRALEENGAHLEELALELETSNEELQRLNAALEDRTREAETANRAKTDFLTAMSHELRTPLNAITGYTDLMELGIRGPVTDEQHADLQRIKQNSRHLLVLINDILHFAKLEAGRIELQPADVPLPELLADAELVMGPMVQAKHIEFNMVRGHDGKVRGDRDRIRQILLNLLSNAVKYTEHGGKVTVLTESDGRSVRIRVRDTGFGIPAERQEQIFDPFVQLARSAGGGLVDGVGLGLAISRQLARAMDGDLAVESVPGVGSTFTLTLQPAGGPAPPPQPSTG